MSALSEIQRRSRHIAFPALGACVLAYFVYHTVQGDHGFLSYLRLNNEVTRAEIALDSLRRDRLGLEHRVGLLDSRSLDLDMLEERLRLDLHRIEPNEFVIFY